MATILVLYYSKGGSVKEMAHLIARGINSVKGAEAKIRTVPEVFTSVEEKAPSIPCVNNNCDEKTCCRESFTCLTWSGTCPTGQSKVDTNPCITDEFSECGQEVCCQLDCSSDNF